MCSKANQRRPPKTTAPGITPAEEVQAKTSGADVPEPDQAGVARLLEPVKARLRLINTSGNLDSASTSDAGEELNRLCESIDVEGDVLAAQVAGLMYFYRSLAVEDLDERGRCYVESLLWFRPVFRSGVGIVPEPIAEVFKDNQRWLADDLRSALSMEAEKIARGYIDNPIMLSIAIALMRKCLQLAPSAAPSPDVPGLDKLSYLSNLGIFLRLSLDPPVNSVARFRLDCCTRSFAR